MLTLDEYWRQHVAAIGRSVGIHPQPGSEAMVINLGGNQAFGAIKARIWFNIEDFLDVYELVLIDNERPHRVTYSYHLQVGGDMVQRWDRQPGDTPELYHHINRPLEGFTGAHVPSDRITLKRAVEECWGLIDEHRGGKWPGTADEEDDED